MYRWLHNATMPKFLKVLLYILLTITCIYWILIATYKLLEIIRICIHFISDKRNWWTYVTCLLILGIGVLLAAQFLLGLDPIGKMIESIKTAFDDFKRGLLA